MSGLNQAANALEEAGRGGDKVRRARVEGYCRRGPLRVVGALLATAAAIAATLVCTSAASANNDPHRIFLPAAPMEVAASYCGFPIHVDFPIDKEYATVSILADGSTVLTVTGSMVAALTNEVSGKTVQVNSSGPGTVTISADGLTLNYDVHGRTVMVGTNLTAFGLPSNIVAVAGPVRVTQATNFGAITSFSGHPQVITDICAVLS
jgi:hypothetical protein